MVCQRLLAGKVEVNTGGWQLDTCHLLLSICYCSLVLDFKILKYETKGGPLYIASAFF